MSGPGADAAPGWAAQSLEDALPAPVFLRFTSASFALGAALCLTPGLGDAAGAALAAEAAAARAHTLPLMVHATTLCLSLTSYLLFSSKAARQASLLMFVSGVASATHALLAFAPVAASVSAFGTLTTPLRTVAWMHSTPTMLLLISELAGASPADAAKLVALQEVCLATALAGEMATHVVPAYLWMSLSFISFVPLIKAMTAMFDAGMARSAPGSLRARAVHACRTSVLTLWCAYPVLFLAAATGLLPPVPGETVWGVVDAVTKSLFAATLLHANTVTRDEADLVAVRAVTEAKARLVASLCHEIRNPLNGIMCSLTELEEHTCDGGGSDEVVSLVAGTLTCAGALRRTLDDFMDLSKAHAAALRVSISATPVAALLAAVGGQVLRPAREKGLCVHLSLEPGLGGAAFLLDGGRVAQVLSNFAWNACKFTKAGGLTLGAAREKPGVLLFEVSDTGPGLTQAQVASLFAPFVQVHAAPAVGSADTKFGGTGLGLNICKVLAGLLGGSVGATSQPGVGSTFWLRLPCTEIGGWGSSAGADGDAAVPSFGVPCASCGVLGAVALAPPPAAAARADGRSPGRALPTPQQAQPAQAQQQQQRGEQHRRAAAGAAGGAREHAAPLQLSPAAAAATTAHAQPRLQQRDVAAPPPPPPPPQPQQPQPAGAPPSPAPPAAAPAAAGGSADEALRDAVAHAAAAFGSPSQPSLQPPPQPSPQPQPLPQPSLQPSPQPSQQLPQPPQQPPHQPSLAPWPGALRSVLVVDDEPVNSAIIVRRLQREAPSVSVTVADDGSGLVDLCVSQAKAYDVVVCDQNMREVNGDEAIAKLRSAEGAANRNAGWGSNGGGSGGSGGSGSSDGGAVAPARAPAARRQLAVACTGATSPDDLARLAAAGFDAFVVKPLDLRRLTTELAALVAGRHDLLRDIRVLPVV